MKPMHMFRTSCCLFLLVAISSNAPVVGQNLFEMRRTKARLTIPPVAREVGDLLTIVIQERHRIRNEDTTERSNETRFNARLDAYTLTQNAFPSNVLPDIDVRQLRSFDGEASQERDSSFEARVSVIVIDRLPNGTLVVAGTRIINIDDETKTLRISGLVRALDVTANNTVNSSQVADARVSITGEGANTHVITRGPVAAMFDTLFWVVWPF